MKPTGPAIMTPATRSASRSRNGTARGRPVSLVTRGRLARSMLGRRVLGTARGYARQSCTHSAGLSAAGAPALDGRVHQPWTGLGVWHRYPCPMAATSTIDTIVSLCKRRGFVFPCGEIYGGTRSAWDYGPLGVELKDNIKRQWWKSMVQQRDDVVGLDSSVILPTKTWEASGHVATFTDPLTECQSCHHRFRAETMVARLTFGERVGERRDVARGLPCLGRQDDRGVQAHDVVALLNHGLPPLALD